MHTPSRHMPLLLWGLPKGPVQCIYRSTGHRDALLLVGGVLYTSSVSTRLDRGTEYLVLMAIGISTRGGIYGAILLSGHPTIPWE